MRLFVLILVVLLSIPLYGSNVDGVKYFKNDEINLALISFNNTIRESSNKDSLVVAYHYLGYLYSLIGEVDKSLENSIKAIEIYEKLGRSTDIIGVYNNIAIMYYSILDYDDAEKYYTLALDEAYKSNNKEYICIIHNNLGGFYVTKDDYKNATKHLNKSLDYNDTNYVNEANTFLNLGIVMYKKGELDKCRFYLSLSEKIITKRHIDDDNIIFMINLHRYYIDKDLDKLNTLLTFKDKVSLSNYLYAVKEKVLVSDDKEKALNEYDSLTEICNDNKRNNLMVKYEKRFDLHRKNAEIKELNSKNLLQSERIKNGYYLFIGLLIILVILSSFFTLVWFKNKTINKKNKVIEVKNNEIVDSINYAKHVQVALNDNNNLFDSMFGNEKGSVIYRPKDILSGDFYWMNETEDAKYFGVIDCTGHGIYGGMLTMLVGSGLDNIVSHNKNVDLNNLIMKLDEHIRKSLDNVRLEDVMDFVICKIDKSMNKMTTINKGNKLTLISDGELSEYKCLSETTIDYQSGDSLYLFSDGLRDQFGGQDGKKYKLSRQRDLLLEVQPMSISEQVKTIDDRINEWIGTHEQNDDITIMCIKL